MRRRQGTPTAALLIVLALAACTGDETAKASLAAAEAALASNDPAFALIEAKNALQKSPKSSLGRHLLGLALLRTGDASGAEVASRGALELGHPHELVVLALAQSMLAQSQFKPVIDEFANTALAKPQSQARLKTLLATAYRVQGDNEMAEAELATALQADPQHTPALLQQLRGQAARGDLAGALAAIDSMLLKRPSEADAWLLKGDLQRNRASPAEAALASYRKAAESRPQLPGGHLEVAETLLLLGRSDEAAAPLEAGMVRWQT